VELLLMRAILVLHNLVALPLSHRLTFCLSRCIAYQVPSLVTLVPVFANASLIILTTVLWSNPLQSWHELSNTFIFFALQSCVTIIALQTVLMEIYLEKVLI
jgi:hypothetical protein